MEELVQQLSGSGAMEDPPPAALPSRARDLANLSSMRRPLGTGSTMVPLEHSTTILDNQGKPALE